MGFVFRLPFPGRGVGDQGTAADFEGLDFPALNGFVERGPANAVGIAEIVHAPIDAGQARSDVILIRQCRLLRSYCEQV